MSPDYVATPAPCPANRLWENNWKQLMSVLFSMKKELTSIEL
jgi:hypothetical protein